MKRPTLSSRSTTPVDATPEGTTPPSGGFSVAPGVDHALTTGDDDAFYRAIADMTAGLGPIPLTRPGTGRPYHPAAIRPGGAEDGPNAPSNFDGPILDDQGGEP